MLETYKKQTSHELYSDHISTPPLFTIILHLLHNKHRQQLYPLLNIPYLYPEEQNSPLTS